MQTLERHEQTQQDPAATTKGAPIVDIRELTKVYPNGHRALDAVTLAIDEGELTVILGANGSGKSTLLRCVVRLIEPTSGSVHVAGRDVMRLSGAALRDARRSVAMVFQHASLIKRRTALANVATGALGRRHDVRTALGLLPRSELGEAWLALQRVGLEQVAHQRADTLSGGQAQRVAIARGLCQRPRVLLADEPVASLDPEAAEDVMALLRQLAAEQRLGVVCVLHQPELATRYADRIIGLRRGVATFDVPAAEARGDLIAALYRSEAA